MTQQLQSYFVQRPENSVFVLGGDLPRLLADLFGKPDWLLPHPYKIFFADEADPPILGFPVLHSEALRDLDVRLDRWLMDEVRWQLKQEDARERSRQSFVSYVAAVMKLVENAMMSNLLADYHGVFWLAHSFDLSRQMVNVIKKVAAIDVQAAKTQGETIKYRIYSKWASEMREQMSRLGARLAPILDGEQERGLKFFRVMQDNVFVFTEEFIGPDLRELRSFVGGYLHRDFGPFKEMFDRLHNHATELAKRDATFRGVVGLFGVPIGQGIPIGLMLDLRFQDLLLANPAVESLVSREDREQLRSVSRRLQEYAILNALRRGIVWMTQLQNGDTVSLDRRTGVVYSKATRPIDFGRPGVVDPMVYRFGLMYDISAFSQTLGDVARGGQKGEYGAYRQMLLFQRKLSGITDRHVLQFEKFLGDGAFYTTRRALRLVFASIEIQRFYAEMRRRGFAFNKGLRIALNFGYYRLLPLKGAPDSSEHVIEFYGPGIVELSRLTTGKAEREVEEMKNFLVSHGFAEIEVQKFFAPLKSGADMSDTEAQRREFFAHVDTSGHLVNEGIVASMGLIRELSQELATEGQQLHHLLSSWGGYVGFSSPIEGVDYVGVRLIGRVALKGLDKIEVAEIVGFGRSEVTATRSDESETMFSLLRQEFFQSTMARNTEPVGEGQTREGRVLVRQLLVCISADAESGALTVLLGEWDPAMDSVRHCLRLAAADLEFPLGVGGEITVEQLEINRLEILNHYTSQPRENYLPSVPMETIRQQPALRTFLLGDTVEAL